MSVTNKPIIISSLTAMLTVTCSAADTYGLFKHGGPLCNFGSNAAYHLCFCLLCWSLACMVAILRKLEVAFITKLFWVGLAVVPFMILLLLMW